MLSTSPTNYAFASFEEAGRALAGELQHVYAQPKTLLLACTPCGDSVAQTVAQQLALPLAWLPARSVHLAANGRIEVAVLVGNETLLHDEILSGMDVDAETLEHAIEEERARMESDRPMVDLDTLKEYDTIILVNDAVIYGRRIRGTLHTVTKHAPSAKLVVAAPVMDSETVHLLKRTVSEVVTIRNPPRRTFGGPFHLAHTNHSVVHA
jgi:predicted phosphoribosyltransferase